MELDLQAKLVDIFKAEGGSGMKMAHAYNTGIPDLLLMHRLLEKSLCFIEVKRMTIGRALEPVPIKPVQLNTLRLYTSIGVKCGIGIFSKEFEHDKTWRLSLHPVRGLIGSNGNSVKVSRAMVNRSYRTLNDAREDFPAFVRWMVQRFNVDAYDEEQSGLSYFTKRIIDKKKDDVIWKVR